MSSTPISYSHEMMRKAIHFSSLWIPLIYYYLDHGPMVLILTCVTALMVICDVMKHRNKTIGLIVARFFSKILRTHEHNSMLSGASYVMIAAWLTVFFFPKIIALVAFTILIVADSVAALIGRRYGKIPIFNKTLEGTLAFILSGFWVVIFYGYLLSLPFNFYLVGLIAALVGAVMELFSGKLGCDDNISIPLTISATMYFLNFILVW